MRVLVTGGAGFIGSHVVENLLLDGHEVVVLDDLSTGHRDHVPPGATFHEGHVQDADAVAGAVEGCDAVVHLAAKTSVPESFEDPAAYAEVNVLGTWTVLKAAADAGAKTVVLASSAAVYGPPQADVQVEDQPPRPLDPYGMTKLTNEVQAAAAASWGLATVALRFFNVYGPRQNPTGPYASVVPRFIAKALADRPLTIFGDGMQKRDLVHVDDIVQAILLGLRIDHGHLVANVGSGVATSVNEVAKAVQSLDPGTAARHEPPRAGDVACSVADIRRAESALGYVPQVAFEQGIRRTYEAFRAMR